MAAALLGAAAVAALGAGVYEKLKASGKLPSLGGCSQPPIQQGPRIVGTLYQQFPRYAGIASYSNDPVSDDVYQSFWNAIVQPPHKSAWPGDRYTIPVLPSWIARHVIYWKKNPPKYQDGQLVSPGDCGSQSSAGSGALGDAVGGINLAGESASIAQGIGKFTGTLGAFVKAIPIVGEIAGEAIHEITSIFTHHAQAVAQEQETLCAAAAEMNSAIDQVAEAVASGAWSPSQGTAELTQVYQAYQQQWRGVIPNSGEAPIIGWAFAGTISTWQWLWSHCYGVPA